MKLVLGALVLVLVAACSSGDGESKSDATPTPSATATKKATTPESDLPPRQRLKAAKLAISRATRGAYEMTVYVDGLEHPLLQESGRFDARHEVMELVRTIQNVSDEEPERSSTVMRIRGSRGARFMQMDDWGVWEGCWLEMGNETVGGLVGADIPSVPEIPVPVALLVDATIPTRNRPAAHRPAGTPGVVTAASIAADDDLRILVDAPTAVQALGVGGRTLFELDPALARVRVPATISFSFRHPEVVRELTLDGDEVLRAIRAADIDLDPAVEALVGAAFNVVTFSEAVTPVVFESPPSSQLIPPDAGPGESCPAAAG